LSRRGSDCPITIVRTAALGASFPFPLASAEVDNLNGHRLFSLGGTGQSAPFRSFLLAGSNCLSRVDVSRVSQPETESKLLILAFSLEIIPHPAIDSVRVSREWCAYAHIDKGCGLSQVLAHVYGLPMTDLHPHIDKPVNDEEIGPPYNRVKAIGDIKKALICPLTWSEVFRIDADESFQPLDLLR